LETVASIQVYKKVLTFLITVKIMLEKILHIKKFDKFRFAFGTGLNIFHPHIFENL